MQPLSHVYSRSIKVCTEQPFLDVYARCILKLCTEQPVFHVYARSIKVCTEQPFLDVYAGSILKLCTDQPVFHVHARSIKVCNHYWILALNAYVFAYASMLLTATKCLSEHAPGRHFWQVKKPKMLGATNIG